jgi:hypothetical protein
MMHDVFHQACAPPTYVRSEYYDLVVNKKLVRTLIAYIRSAMSPINDLTLLFICVHYASHQIFRKIL